MPRKVFIAGEILTAADVNTNLMDQAVMSFAGTAARGSAIPSPVEGMVSYLNDLDALTVYNGSSWVPAASGATLGSGSILQVVSTSKTDTFSTSSTSYTQVTGMAATITPSSASSKIVVLGQFVVSNGDNSNRVGAWKITRGGTDFYVGNADGNRTRAIFGGNEGTQALLNTSHSIMTVDSPATTSATTYRLECKASNGTIHLNRSNTDSNDVNNVRGASSIILMEVAG